MNSMDNMDNHTPKKDNTLVIVLVIVALVVVLPITIIACIFSYLAKTVVNVGAPIFESAVEKINEIQLDETAFEAEAVYNQIKNDGELSYENCKAFEDSVAIEINKGVNFCSASNIQIELRSNSKKVSIVIKGQDSAIRALYGSDFEQIESIEYIDAEALAEGNYVFKSYPILGGEVLPLEESGSESKEASGTLEM